jgi:hypothetical protein
MKKGDWVVAYRSISDESAVKAYGALALPAVEPFGGRFLTRSISQIQTHEAGLLFGRFLSNSTAMTLHWRPMRARLTKGRFRHSVLARNVTFASSTLRKVATETVREHAVRLLECQSFRRSLPQAWKPFEALFARKLIPCRREIISELV